jgi:NAD dependent epimerase/dehydratase
MELSGRTVLVTGGTGFIGSHLVEQLIAEGCRVRVLANYKSRPDVGNLAFVNDVIRGRLDVIWGDVCDRDSVMHVTDGVSVIFHLAALIGIPYSYIAPESYIRTNIQGTLNVLQSARNRDIERVIHTSTSEVFGSAQRLPIDETHPLVGQSPYAAAKIGADKLVESFARSFDLSVTTVRPFNVFGPRQSDRAVIPTIIAQSVAGIDPIRIGDASPRRDFTFVTDTAAGFVRAALCDQAIGRTINLGSGCSISVGDLAARICRKTGGGRVATENNRQRPRRSEVSELLCDNTLARELLGWSPRVSLDEGLDRTIAFVRENPQCFTPERYRV